ncbi:AAA family ATPase [Streptomyces microflavus]|uniref:AAA family ATPase n=1 Tax=Streptomyces microflavus TaxID=1919 RepID=UPI0035DAD9EB
MNVVGQGTERVRLPLVKRMTISHFSLYRNRSENVVSFDKRVFCLAGANGLGKSTFLAILNYSITGAVAQPDVKVLSLPEYFKKSKTYALDYFTGRVTDDDREIAEVTVEFSLGEYSYVVTRGMFYPTELRSLSITGPDVNVQREAGLEDSVAGQEMHEEYVSHILKHTGLAQFEQLVYLQHFLVTFDERRHLLFWDPEVARFALFLVFGMDTARADKVGDWQRKADRLESQARNAQYQATSARSQIRDLLTRAGGEVDVDTDLEGEHRGLSAERDEAAARVEEKIAQEKDQRLQVGIAAAEHHALTIEYNRAFSDRSANHAGAAESSVILRLLHERHCGVCGTEDVASVDEVAGLIDQGVCPLCRTPSSDSGESDDFSVLRELDVQLQGSNDQLSNAQKALDRATRELEEARQDLSAVSKKLQDFEKIHSEWLLDQSSRSGVSKVVQQLEAERLNAIDRRDDFRRKRDEFYALIEPVKQELAERYAEAEIDFLPRFQTLARAFLGLDLHCELDKKARGPELVVTINNQKRREQNQLSESQRYFIDIALRMALTEYMIGPDGSASLLIDTPEGSLDIAYEARAGEMFGEFVTRGNRIIMTANLNSNRLVLELANVCRRDLMHVERMTNWSVLSEVQAQSENLFDKSYEDIQVSLDGMLL